jgi:hypothetical protein
MDVGTLLRRARTERVQRPVLVGAVDGRRGAGKASLARILPRGSTGG